MGENDIDCFPESFKTEHVERNKGEKMENRAWVSGSRIVVEVENGPDEGLWIQEGAGRWYSGGLRVGVRGERRALLEGLAAGPLLPTRPLGLPSEFCVNS